MAFLYRSLGIVSILWGCSSTSFDAQLDAETESPDAGEPDASSPREFAFSTPEWTPLEIALHDLQSDAATFELAESPTRGWVALEGSVATYFPEPYFDGTDSFELRAVGEDDSIATYTVSIVVESTSAIDDEASLVLSEDLSRRRVDFEEQTYLEREPNYTLDYAAFCRLFYDPDIEGQEGLWLAASVKSSDYGDGYFMIKGLDLDLNMIAGTERILTDNEGARIRASGDTHHATDGRYYYAAVGGCGNSTCTGGDGHGAIYQFDRDWVHVGTHRFDFEREHYRSNDMLFAYANRQVFFGITYAENCGEEPNELCTNITASGSGGALYAFSPETEEFTAPYMLGGDSISPMGGTLVFTEEGYWLIGNDSSPQALSAYRYDSLSEGRAAMASVSEDGQWEQGALVDDGHVFVIHHSGIHGWGDVDVVAWNQDFTSSSNVVRIDVDQGGDAQRCGQGEDAFDISDNCDPSSAACAGVVCDGVAESCTSCSYLEENAQRPFVTRVRDRLYYAYDFAGERFTATPRSDDLNWQSSNVEEKSWECYVGAISLSTAP